MVFPPFEGGKMIVSWGGEQIVNYWRVEKFRSLKKLGNWMIEELKNW